MCDDIMGGSRGENRLSHEKRAYQMILIRSCFIFFVRAAPRTILTNVTPTVNSAQAPLRHTEGSA